MQHLFASLNVYRDNDRPRSAAMNMAIDEALLERAKVPSIRFYRWDRPALSFGYFGKFEQVEPYGSERDLVRRWTGGGIVFHGDDLTYSIVIPANDPAFRESSMSIYEKVHRAVCGAFVAKGARAELLSVAALYERRNQPPSAVIDRRYRQNACFANPVRADVLLNGRKVAGAAQRRTRRGLLQQGSIQSTDLKSGFVGAFARALCSDCHDKYFDEALLASSAQIAEKKYGTESWLCRR